VESISINKQIGKVDIQLKDGYIAKLGTDDMKSGKLMRKFKITEKNQQLYRKRE
jgi:hypothetical protein